MRRSIFPTALALALAASACSDDSTAGNTDPGGMGAGRAEGAQTPADSILTTANQPGNQDTTEAGSATVQGQLRDSITSLSQPQRPAGTDSVIQGTEPRRP